jgi:hypothetical protein
MNKQNLKTKILTFQVQIEELKFNQLFHTPHLQKSKGEGESINFKQKK